jgi:predicted ArsR family transcriptional regulator
MAVGPEFTVERTQHLMSGDQRCVYRIARVPATRHAVPESKTAPE